MGLRERNQALDMIKSLMDHDFSAKPLQERLGQVDQGYGVTHDMLEAIAKQSDDASVQALADLVLQAWKH